MEPQNEYEKFTKYLTKEVFKLEEVRQFVESEYVANVARMEPDSKRPNHTKYAIRMVDGDVYFVYVKNNK